MWPRKIPMLSPTPLTVSAVAGLPSVRSPMATIAATFPSSPSSTNLSHNFSANVRHGNFFTVSDFNLARSAVLNSALFGRPPGLPDSPGLKRNPRGSFLGFTLRTAAKCSFLSRFESLDIFASVLLEGVTFQIGIFSPLYDLGGISWRTLLIAF
jgi:hypothetical protein